MPLKLENLNLINKFIENKIYKFSSLGGILYMSAKL